MPGAPTCNRPLCKVPTCVVVQSLPAAMDVCPTSPRGGSSNGGLGAANKEVAALQQEVARWVETALKAPSEPLRWRFAGSQLTLHCINLTSSETQDSTTTTQTTGLHAPCTHPKLLPSGVGSAGSLQPCF